jgi:S1-C subfamily serine protease
MTILAENARDRIGGGPWYNVDGDVIGQNLAQLHGAMSKLDRETAVTESAEKVSADRHEILTGSRPDGTAFVGRRSPGSRCRNGTPGRS